MADPDSTPRWLRRAERFSDAYGLVLLLTMATFLALSLLPSTQWARVVGIALASATGLVGLESSSVSLDRLRAARMAAAVAIALAIVAGSLNEKWVIAAATLVAMSLLTVSAVTILRRVLQAPEVSFRTILGALSTYTILGLLFAFLYLVVEIVQGDPFFVATSESHNGQFLFFSYTTLTTTGYGNLVPAGQPGESFAVFEMLTGQIYLVTLVAGLVSLWRPTGSDGGRRGGLLGRIENELQGDGGSEPESEPSG